MSPRTVIYLAIGSMIFTIAIVVVIYLLGRGLQHAAPKAREPTWFRRVRDSRFGWMLPSVVVPLAFLSVAGVLTQVLTGGSVILRLLDNLPMAGVFAALPLIGRSKVSTGGLLCAKCKYNVESLAPPIPEGQSKRSVHDEVCPECGSQFGWPGGAISEHHEWRMSRLILPLILLLPMLIQFGSIPFVGVLWWKSALHRLVPTDSLIVEATNSRSFTMAAWDELSRRSLTAEQDRRIALALLSPPPRPYFNTDERKWLSAAIAAQSMDPDLLRPWLERMLVVTRSSTAAERVRIKCDTEFLMPFYDMSITLHLITDPPSQQEPLTIRMAGSEPYNAYWLGTLPAGVQRAWVDAAVHVPGEIVTKGASGEEMSASPKALYFLRIPVVPVPDDAATERVTPLPGVPQPNR